MAVARAAAPVFRAVRRYPRIMRLPDFRGSLAANGHPNVIMPMGVTYLSICLRFTIAGVAATQAQIIAQIAAIHGILDGDDKLAGVSPNELLAMQNFWNSRFGLTNVSDGVLRIELSRPWDQEIDAQDGPGWGMATGVPGGVGNFSMVLDLAGAVTIDGINAWAEVTDAAPLGRHITYRRYTDNQAAAGDKTFADFTMDPTWSVYALHVDKPSTPEGGALITDIALKVDQVAEIEKISAGALQNRYQRYGCVKQVGFTHVPFAVRGRPLETLPLVAQDMRLTLSTTGAIGNYNILSEQLEGVDP